MNMSDNDIPENEVLDLDNKEVFYVCNVCGGDGNGGLCEHCHQWFCEECLDITRHTDGIEAHWLCASCLAVLASSSHGAALEPAATPTTPGAP